MDSTTQTTFSSRILLYQPGYQLKPVKGSSKVLDFDMFPRYYYALHTSMDVHTYIYSYIHTYHKSQIGAPLIMSRLPA